MTECPIRSHGSSVHFQSVDSLFRESRPQSAGDLDFFFADRIRVDRGCLHPSVPEPALDQIERDTALNRRYAKAMPQPARRCVRAAHTDLSHDFLDAPISRHPMPGPNGHGIVARHGAERLDQFR